MNHSVAARDDGDHHLCPTDAKRSLRRFDLQRPPCSVRTSLPPSFFNSAMVSLPFTRCHCRNFFTVALSPAIFLMVASSSFLNAASVGAKSVYGPSPLSDGDLLRLCSRDEENRVDPS